jgi:hypothetical protein
VAADLASELETLRAICAGAAAQTSRQLGMEPVQAVPDDDVRAFLAWSAAMASDPDLAGDARVMVPVFFDRERKLTKVWAVLGWTRRPVVLSYAKPPALSITRDGKAIDAEAAEVMFEEAYQSIAYPVTVEVYVKEPLDREAFRAICDRFRTRTAILRQLR